MRFGCSGNDWPSPSLYHHHSIIITPSPSLHHHHHSITITPSPLFHHHHSITITPSPSLHHLIPSPSRHHHHYSITITPSPSLHHHHSITSLHHHHAITITPLLSLHHHYSITITLSPSLNHHHSINNSDHNPNSKNIVNFVSNKLEELPTIYFSPKSLLTFHTNFNMYPTKPFSPSPPEIFIFCKKRPTSSDPELSAGNSARAVACLSTSVPSALLTA